MIDQWHDFFVMVGSGAAALTGLVFVAMSLNLETIVKDATHRYRAIGTLSGFAAAFMICALGLMGGQNYQVVGIEWLMISVIATFIYINGYVQAKKKSGSLVGMPSYRLVFGTALYIVEIIAASILALGYLVGLYIAAVTLVSLLAYTITGAWLLLVGVHREIIGQRSKK